MDRLFAPQSTSEEMADVMRKHAEYMANIEAETINAYYLLCIKKKPKYLPNFLWHFLIKRIIVLANFRKI